MFVRVLLPVLLATTFGCTGARASGGLIPYAVTDLRAVWFTDDWQAVDWGAVADLNRRQGCAVEIVLLDRSRQMREQRRSLDQEHVSIRHVWLDAADTAYPDSLFGRLWTERRPDIVVFSFSRSGDNWSGLANRLANWSPATERLYNVERVFALTHGSKSGTEPRVHIHSWSLYERHNDAIARALAELLPGVALEPPMLGDVRTYRLLYSGEAGLRPVDLVGGLIPMRLERTYSRLLPEGPLRTSLTNRARNVVSLLRMAGGTDGTTQVDNLLAAYRELMILQEQSLADTRLQGNPEYVGSLGEHVRNVRAAVSDGVGIHWEPSIVVRDSPEGPKVKLRSTLAVDGLEIVRVAGLSLIPYWQPDHITIDTSARTLSPPQAWAREYAIPMDPSYLESTRADSIGVRLALEVNNTPLELVHVHGIRARTPVTVRFEPDFFFIPPVAQLDVDKVVAGLSWKAVIEKPLDYSGLVSVKLETPRGLFAGSYQSEVTLRAGRQLEVVRIPFSVSKLFELGVQHTMVTVSRGGSVIASDTGRIRIAACEIKPSVSVGLLADSSGQLEDVLRMTGVDFQPLTDRGLLTADLNAFTVIIAGEQFFQRFPSLRTARGRLEDYVRNGGRLIILGQPEEWPEDILPIGIAPQTELPASIDLSGTGSESSLLKKPYGISDKLLFEYFSRRTAAYPAVVAPAETLYRTTSGGSLLTVSRIGNGDLVYCGLPLLDMVSALNIEAIHLLANLLNS